MTADQQLRAGGLRGPRSSARHRPGRRRRLVAGVARPPGVRQCDRARRDEDEYEELRPEMSRGRKIVVVALGVFVVLALLAGLVSFWRVPAAVPDGQGRRRDRARRAVRIVDELDRRPAREEERDQQRLLVQAVSQDEGWRPLPSRYLSAAVARWRCRCAQAPEGGAAPTADTEVHRPPGLNLRQVPAQIITSIPTFSVEKLNAVLAAGQVRSQFQPADKSIEGFLFPDTYEIGEGADETAGDPGDGDAVRQGRE